MTQLEEEYQIIKNYSYYELVDYCRQKYGEVRGNYGTTKARRSSEGLFIHHINEYTTPGLCKKQKHKDTPNEQMPDNLIYCNFLEHMLLHILIKEESRETYGLHMYIVPQIFDYFENNKINSRINIEYYNVIANDFNLFKTLVIRLYHDYDVNQLTRYKIKAQEEALGRNPSWEQYEDDVIIENYITLGPKECYKKLLHECYDDLPMRTYGAFLQRANILGLKVRTSWDENEINIVKKYYRKYDAKYCYRKLLQYHNGVEIRTVDNIYGLVARLNIKGKPINKFSDKEIELLYMFYKDNGPTKCSEIFKEYGFDRPPKRLAEYVRKHNLNELKTSKSSLTKNA